MSRLVIWRGVEHDSTTTALGHAEALVRHAKRFRDDHAAVLAAVDDDANLSEQGKRAAKAKATLEEMRKTISVYDQTAGRLRTDLAAAVDVHRRAVVPTVDLEGRRRAERLREILSHMSDARRAETLQAARVGKIAGGEEIVRAVLSDIPIMSGFRDDDPVLATTRTLFVETRSPETRRAANEVETALEDLTHARDFLAEELTTLGGSDLADMVKDESGWSDLDVAGKAERIRDAVEQGKDPTRLATGRAVEASEPVPQIDDAALLREGGS